MDFQEYKLQQLGITKEKFGRIYSFVDFGNVNHWYENDMIHFVCYQEIVTLQS